MGEISQLSEFHQKSSEFPQKVVNFLKNSEIHQKVVENSQKWQNR